MAAEIDEHCDHDLKMVINGIHWKIAFVNGNDDVFRRSDGTCTVGVTDNGLKTVFLNDRLRGAFLRKVLCHEIVHCFCFSYDISLPIEVEETVADFVATYGTDIVDLTNRIMQDILKNSLVSIS